MDIKKDWSLWLAVTLPFAMIVFVAGSIYLPRLWAPKPQYGFVYTVHDSTTDATSIYKTRVVGEKITKEEVVLDENDMDLRNMKPRFAEPHLYRYDAVTGESKNMTFEEAQTLKLDDRKKSPDGFEVSQGGGFSGPFGGGSEPSLYITGHSTSQKLDLRGADNAYEFEFIGWIVE